MVVNLIYPRFLGKNDKITNPAPFYNIYKSNDVTDVNIRILYFEETSEKTQQP